MMSDGFKNGFSSGFGMGVLFMFVGQEIAKAVWV